MLDYVFSISSTSCINLCDLLLFRRIEMPSYKLTYFSIKGQAEPIRFILSYGGVDFEDDRDDWANWQQIKPSTPFGQLPVLEVDGKRSHQSVSIIRYLGKQFGIAGKNDWEALEIDDLRAEIASWHYDENPAGKEPKYEPLFKKTIPFFMERLDAQVKKNGGYFVGGALSWGDFIFVRLLDYINHMAKYDIIEKYENLKQLKATILDLPSIKAWVEKRPVTEQ